MDSIRSLLTQDPAGLVEAWLDQQRREGALRPDILGEAELREQCADFLRELARAVVDGSDDIYTDDWAEVRSLLSSLTRRRTALGFAPSETATFVFSLKQTLFRSLGADLSADDLQDAIWTASKVLDALGLFTVDIYHRDREQVIRRQRDDLVELSAPMVSIWDGIVCLPLIGTLDSARSQVVMEALLNEIVDREADVAIIDITGVGTVDTQTAQYLIKTVAAARLMGADCIVSGLGPQIAQTMVNLGVELGDIVTRASLAAALRLAFKRRGLRVVAQ